MRPLSIVAIGLLVVTVYDRLGGFDLLADPVGWVLVWVGVTRLPRVFPRPGLVTAVVAALIVSIPLWIPAVHDRLDAADPSLPWALSLPALAFGGWLCHLLAQAATDAQPSDRTATQVLRGLVTLTLAVALLPVLVFGAGIEGLDGTATTLATVRGLALVVVLLIFRSRSWADPATASVNGAAGEATSGVDGKPTRRDDTD